LALIVIVINYLLQKK